VVDDTVIFVLGVICFLPLVAIGVVGFCWRRRVLLVVVFWSFFLDDNTHHGLLFSPLFCLRLLWIMLLPMHVWTGSKAFTHQHRHLLRRYARRESSWRVLTLTRSTLICGATGHSIRLFKWTAHILHQSQLRWMTLPLLRRRLRVNWRTFQAERFQRPCRKTR